MTRDHDDNETTRRTIASRGPADPDPHAACVVVIHGAGLGRRVDVADTPVMIGRSHEADLQINHPSVSRRHCEMWKEGSGYRIRDLGATNPTRINDQVIDENELNDGDHITVGESVLKFISDSSLEASYHEEVYQLATLDALTELHNRRHFVEMLERELARAQRHQRPLTLAIIDLDHFKRVNDQLGHPVGDMVLRQFGAILRQHVRADDLPARIGGEEFAVLLPETDLDHARDYAERLRETVAAASFDTAGQQLQVTVSIGLALIAEGRDSVGTLMRSADRGLYRAKSQGRNRVRTED